LSPTYNSPPPPTFRTKSTPLSESTQEKTVSVQVSETELLSLSLNRRTVMLQTMHGRAAVISIVCIGCLYRYSAPVYLSELYERSGVEYRILSSASTACDDFAVQRTRTKFVANVHISLLEPTTVHHSQFFIRGQF